jgi:pantoate--beta-alanine ligase
MRIVEDPADLADPALTGCGFVPTMGALHAGHGSLVERARRDGRPVVVSIFVNPTQFGPNEDYARYPRTLDADRALLEPLGADAIFVPSVEAMYPEGLEASRAVAAALPLPEVGTRPGLEDRCRPGHFGGVALVVGRLFDMVRPAAAYFGEKDYQQLRLIEDMVAADPARFGALRIVPCPTIRETTGLAMSSRNRYLAGAEREQALALARALQVAHSAQRVETAERLMRETLESHGLEVEYAAVRDARTLLPVTGFERPTRALIAARLGATRLIDNAPMTVWR